MRRGHVLGERQAEPRAVGFGGRTLAVFGGKVGDETRVAGIVAAQDDDGFPDCGILADRRFDFAQPAPRDETV